MKIKVNTYRTVGEEDYISIRLMVLPMLEASYYRSDKELCLSFGWLFFVLEVWFINKANKVAV